MKTRPIILMLCLIIDAVLITKLFLSNDVNLFQVSTLQILQSKQLCLLLNIIVLIKGFVILLKKYNKSVINTRIILIFVMTIMINIFFGIYYKSYFYINLALIAAMYDIFRKTNA
jgi:hypothetical protein